MTVGVTGSSFKGTRPTSEKAEQGAEKSLSKRRRKRGLRKGKLRSRECHSRRTVPTANVSNTMDRRIKHTLRMLDWVTKVSNSLGERIKEDYMSMRAGSFNPESSPRIGWRKYEEMYLRKKRACIRQFRTESDGRVGVNPAFGVRFYDFVGTHCSTKKIRRVKGELSTDQSWQAFQSHMKGIFVPKPVRGNRPAHQASDGKSSYTKRSDIPLSRSNAVKRGGRSGGVTPTTKASLVDRRRRP